MKTAITGGIGSGKSYVCALLQQQGIDIYDCDAAAKRLIRTSAELRRQLSVLIGCEPLTKAAMASFLLESEANARAINAIVHPAVADDFVRSGFQWMECAILFESGFDRLVDRVIVVTAPRDVRIGRIVRRDGITPDEARQWMARQWPQEELRRRAHYEIVNDGVTPLGPQIERIMQSIG